MLTLTDEDIINYWIRDYAQHDENGNVITSNVTFTITLDDKLVEGGIIIVTPKLLSQSNNTETGDTAGEYVNGTPYKLITNEDGVVHKTLPCGEYSIHAEYNSNQQFSYDLDLVKFVSQTENVFISLNRCNNKTLLDKDCKYFLHDPYMTPNNYDLYFNYSQIPVNNIIEPPSELHKRLQRTLPLTKILHLNLETGEEPEYNTVHLHTRCKITYNTLNDDKITFRIDGIWNEDLLMDKVEQARKTDYQNYLTSIPSLAETMYNEWYEEIEEQALLQYSEYLEVDPSTELSYDDFLEPLLLTNSIESIEEKLRKVTFEEFIKQKNWGTNTYKKPITVYMVRVGNEGVNIATLVLNNDNNYQAYTNPLPSMDGDTMIKYKLKYTINSDN